MIAFRECLIVLLGATLAELSGTAMAQTNVVTFVDPNLAAAVSNSLNIKAGPITSSNILSLNLLNAQFMGITNLSGLEGATNLKYLYLTGNSINNLTPLQGLGGLVDLALDRNSIVDISPLAGLTNLASINLGGNLIGDYSTLSGLTNLTSLSLYQSLVSTLAFLKNLNRLAALNVYGDGLVDISPLGALTNLNYLDLRWNGITNYALLSKFSNLTHLFLGANTISNLSFLQSLTGLTFLNLDHSGLSDVSPLAALTNLNYLVVSGNPGITSYTALSGLTKLANLEARGNTISNLAFVSSLSQLNFADFAYNNLTSFSPLMTLTNLAAVNLSGNPNTNFVFGSVTPTNLWLFSQNISDVTYLTNLTQLTALGLDNNSITDFSPLLALTNLNYLGLGRNPITNYTSLAGFAKLTGLSIEGNSVSSVNFLQGLTSLQNLSIRNNRLRDFSALAGLTNLATIYAASNRLTDIGALTNLPNLSRVELFRNLLDLSAGSSASGVIRNLQNRGIEVDCLPSNQPPTLFAAPTWYVPANQTSSLNFYAADVLVSSGELTMTANSSNQSLITNSSITFVGGTNSNGLFLLTPATNQTGVTTITLTVSQPPGGLITSSNLLVNVMFSTNVFLQKGLSNAVALALGNPAGTLSSAEMMYLTSLYADNTHISDLSGLESASNLLTLSLAGNTIRSLISLQNLTSLAWLNLNSDLVTDVSSLAGLSNLEYLDLSWNPVTNFAALSGLTNLTTLHLAGDAITNLSFLTNFTRLNNLDLSFNQITDLTPIIGLTNLASLNLEQNRITDISPLTNLLRSAYVNLSLNLLKSTAIGILASNGITVTFSPQRTPPVIGMITNWTVPVNASNANFIIPFNVRDTGPTSELLGVGASASSASLALKLTLLTSPGANEYWTVTASNYIATNGVMFMLTATNDVGLITNATATLNPVTWLGMAGTITKTQCNLRLGVVPGNTYELQVSTNLSKGWSNLALIAPTNTPMQFVDTNVAPGSRFYRLQGQ